MNVDHVLRSIVEHGASDLHLQVGSPPTARIHGLLSPLKMDPLTTEDLESVVRHVVTDQNRKRLDSDWVWQYLRAKLLWVD